MKGRALLLALALVFGFAFASCGGGGGDDDDSGGEDGTLVFETVVGESGGSKSIGSSVPSGKSSKSVYTCQITDIKNRFPKLMVSSGTVHEGDSMGDFDWYTIYESGGDWMYASELDFSADLPPDFYDNLYVKQSTVFYWVCECEVGGETDTYEFPDQNAGPGEWTENVLNADGSWLVEDGSVTEHMTSGEKMDGFEIRAGGVTRLTYRLNFNTLDWHDNDDSGDWSDGDELDNWTLIEGADTMFDFIVEYE